jgi:hypothetical protein
MGRLFLIFLLALLAGCGSNGGDGGGGSAPGHTPPAEGDLSSLDGLPLEEFVRAIVPRLAEEPSIQNPAQLAASLDQIWKIHCEQNCRIERK